MNYTKRFAWEVVNLLKTTTSRTEKEKILKDNENNIELRTVLKFAYDPFIVFGIKKIPEYRKLNGGHSEISKTLKDIRSTIVSRKFTGDKAIMYLTRSLEELDHENQLLLEAVIAKNLNCGVSSSTINKVLGRGFIPVYGCMLADKYNEKTSKNIHYPAIASTKIDGGRINIIYSDGSAKAYSRNGKLLKTDNIFTNNNNKSHVIDGEAIFLDVDGKVLPRTKSNGLFNKMVKHTITEDELGRLRVLVFDCIPFSDFSKGISDIPYTKRLSILKEEASNNSVFELVNQQEVNSEAELLSFYQEQLNKGEEGAMIRNANDGWKAKRVKNLLKLKNELTCELRVTELIEGTGKYKGFLGNFVASSQCGKLSVGVGSGLSDKQRKDYFNLEMIDKIITVKYNEVLLSDNEYSLFLPIFIEVREDKEKADNLETIQKGR